MSNQISPQMKMVIERKVRDLQLKYFCMAEELAEARRHRTLLYWLSVAGWGLALSLVAFGRTL